MKGLGIATAVVVGVVVVLAATIALNGFMLSYMWQWFVVPLGARPIGIAQAIGIATLVSMLTRDLPDDKRESGDAFEGLLKAVCVKAFAFGIAFCLSFAVPA